MTINVRTTSTKKQMNLSNIKIPAHFEKHLPTMEKFVKHCREYYRDGQVLDPIIVNEKNELIDGYISYLILNWDDVKRVNVFQIKIHVC